MKLRASILGLVAAGVLATGIAAQQTTPRGASSPGRLARIAVIVVSAEDSRQPIRRAMVTIDGPSQRSQITDDDGRFVFEGVPGGEYDVTATRAAFGTSSASP